MNFRHSAGVDLNYLTTSHAVSPTLHVAYMGL